MPHNPFAGCRVVGFDLETTGLNKNKDRIIQFSLVGSDEDDSVINYEALVNPQIKIPTDSTEVHGIKDEDVKNLKTFDHHIHELNELFNDAVVVGHNVKRFDWPFISNEYLRFGEKIPKPKAIIDTLIIARKLNLPRPHSLGRLCKRYGVSLENAHDAGADAAASLLLLWKIIESQPKPFRRPLEDLQTWLTSDNNENYDSLGKGFDDLEPFDSEGKIRISEDDLIVVFGKYRGLTLQQIASNDETYLNWLLSTNGPFQSEDITKIKKKIS